MFGAMDVIFVIQSCKFVARIEKGFLFFLSFFGLCTELMGVLDVPSRWIISIVSGKISNV